MHELSLMQNIFEIVIEELKNHGLVQVDVVTLKVGELTGVEESAMQFAFSVLKEGTVLENSILKIIHIPAKGYCSHCDIKYPLDRYRIICPTCGRGGRIIAGKELYVESLEVSEI